MSSLEKSGNANWAQCPACGAWFHVATTLLRLETVDLACPGCGETFPPAEAKALIESERRHPA